MTADEVQYALTYSQDSPFYMRKYYVVPNVSWGLDFNHELDLLAISKCFSGTEIEIKVSKSDLKRDLQKGHGHRDPRIRQLYFAGPIELEEAFFEYVPKDAGIITVYRNPKAIHLRYQCVIRRKAKANRSAKAFTDGEVFRLLRLGNMRYWSMFHKNLKNKKENENV